jgi:tetratricopeptide (TPR) repeat protein
MKDKYVKVLAHLSMAQLGNDDRDGFRQTCALMLERYGRTSDADIANAVAWTCSLGANAVADTAWPVGLAEQAVAASRTYANLNTLGVALYRDGKFDLAIKTLNEAIEANDKNGTALDWLFLAMAHQRNGNKEEAGKFLDKAGAWIDDALKEKKPLEGKALHWTQRQELKLLRKEAEALIKGDKP